MNIRRIAIQADELFGEDDARGMPVDGSRSVRCILMVDDDSGQIMRATFGHEGYLEHSGASTVESIERAKRAIRQMRPMPPKTP